VPDIKWALAAGAVVGGGAEGLGEGAAGYDRIERRPPRDEVIAKPEHWRHG